MKSPARTRPLTALALLVLFMAGCATPLLVITHPKRLKCLGKVADEETIVMYCTALPDKGA